MDDQKFRLEMYDLNKLNDSQGAHHQFDTYLDLNQFTQPDKQKTLNTTPINEDDEELKVESEMEERNYVRIIRTPISNRTFIIGGSTTKEIREVVYSSKTGRFYIKQIQCINKPHITR